MVSSHPRDITWHPRLLRWSTRRRPLAALVTPLVPHPHPQASSSSAPAPRAIPLSAAPVDVLRQGGPISFKQASLSAHPVEAAQAGQAAHEWDRELRLRALAYGGHAAMERRMDRAALSQIQRLPGAASSSHALLDSLLRRDAAIGDEDVLNGAERARSPRAPRALRPPPLTRPPPPPPR
jgi:hypothetical protein